MLSDRLLNQLWAWQKDNAQLLYEALGITLPPMLNNLSLRDVIDVHDRNLDFRPNVVKPWRSSASGMPAMGRELRSQLSNRLPEVALVTGSVEP